MQRSAADSTQYQFNPLWASAKERPKDAGPLPARQQIRLDMITDAWNCYLSKRRGISMKQNVVSVVRATACSIVAATAAGGVDRATAQSAPPTAYLQDSTIVGSANTLTITRVPVVSGGTITYEDVTIQFTVGASGLQIAAGYPVVTASPTLKTARFVAGSYIGPGTATNFLLTVSGPGVASGGATEWSLQASSDANTATSPISATWYVGALANNPNAARLKAAGITSTAYNYGLAGGTSTNQDENFNFGHLLGFSQTGTALSIYSFTDGNFKDYPRPIDQITYTLQPK